MALDLGKAGLSFRGIRRHIHPQEPSPDDFELLVGRHDLFWIAAAMRYATNPESVHEADNAGGNVVQRKLIQSRQQPIAGRLLFPLQTDR